MASLRDTPRVYRLYRRGHAPERPPADRQDDVDDGAAAMLYASPKCELRFERRYSQDMSMLFFAIVTLRCFELSLMSRAAICLLYSLRGSLR